MDQDGKYTEQDPGYYVCINGEKVPVTYAQRKGWYEMVNNTRRYARTFKTCGQADFRKCCGDCGLCAYKREGLLISMDDPYQFGKEHSCGGSPPDASSLTAEEEVLKQETREWLYQEAEKIVTRGGEILYLKIEIGLSAHQISMETGIAKTTVVGRIRKLIRFIREHKEEFF